MTKKIGIVALKLNHSLSPLIHNYWSKKLNLKFKYNKYELKEKNINKFFTNFKKNINFKGFNVTIPYKEIFLEQCDRISVKANQIGSINLIYKKNGLIYGDNTDIVGFRKCYKSLNINNPKSILVVGAGGAARSILYYLNNKKFNNIDIYAPSMKRKKGLESDFNFKKFVSNTSRLRKKYDLIINASSAGMVGKTKLNRNIIKLVNKSRGVIDIVYNPVETALLNEAKKNGVKNIGGLKMLVEQAKPSFERWSNKKVKVTNELYRTLERKIK